MKTEPSAMECPKCGRPAMPADFTVEVCVVSAYLHFECPCGYKWLITDFDGRDLEGYPK